MTSGNFTQFVSKPISNIFIGPSLVTWSQVNPAFVVIDVDAEYMVPIDIHTYAANQTYSNANVQEGKMNWSH